ncbi:unannotated protein [freshwater metagenome]|uniref:Unannotated protein n=1 Tax=freshwater metagenome TaxID=449393 RepID=A0A6J7GJD3_9ZZZZ
MLLHEIEGVNGGLKLVARDELRKRFILTCKTLGACVGPRVVEHIERGEGRFCDGSDFGCHGGARDTNRLRPHDGFFPQTRSILASHGVPAGKHGVGPRE